MKLAVVVLCLLVGVYCKQTVILQAFDWNSLSNRTALYPQIQAQSSNAASAGITHVWFPPPSQSADQQG